MKYTAARGPSDQPARDMGGRREGSGAECSTLNLTTLSPRPWVGGAVERGLEKADKRTWRPGRGGSDRNARCARRSHLVSMRAVRRLLKLRGGGGIRHPGRA
jgi:hypothetical protein